MLRIVRRLISLATMAFVALMLFIPTFAILQDLTEPDQFAPADVIMVFGAGMDPDGTLHRSTILRVERGVALYHQGAAPWIHMSGGAGITGGPSAGDGMRDLAVSLGVPRDVISSEGQSLSTLQNALFSLPDLPEFGRIIAVSEGFHLPRVWASLHWAALNHGHRFDVALSNSEPFRSHSPNAQFPKISMTFREALATGFNILRALGWQVGGVIGAENRDDWLN